MYTAATRFLVLGQFGNMAIGRAAQPRLAELFALDDRHGTNLVYQATSAWLILRTGPLGMQISPLRTGRRICTRFLLLGRVYSTITIASALTGAAAPVMMAAASPE